MQMFSRSKRTVEEDSGSVDLEEGECSGCPLCPDTLPASLRGEGRLCVDPYRLSGSGDSTS